MSADKWLQRVVGKTAKQLYNEYCEKHNISTNWEDASNKVRNQWFEYQTYIHKCEEIRKENSKNSKTLCI